MKDGGSAFPVLEQVRSNLDCTDPGMTLRDYFAGQALAGLFALSTVSKEDDLLIAKACYGAADAMLAEREKSK